MSNSPSSSTVAGVGATGSPSSLSRDGAKFNTRRVPLPTCGNIASLVAGMLIAGTTLGAFWWLQFHKQGRLGPGAERPGDVPTWQHRYAQQLTAASNETNANTVEVTEKYVFESKQKPTFLAPNIPVPGDSKGFETGLKGSVLSFVHNNWKDGTHVEQPSKPCRFGDGGRTYTKNTNYTDSYDPNSYRPNSRGHM